MARPALSYVQATRRRDALFAQIEALCYDAQAAYDWAQRVLADPTQPITGPDGGTLQAGDRATVVADYAVLSQVADLLRNRHPNTGQDLGVDIMYAIRPVIVPGVNAE